jgi:hypothetical protein
MSRKTTFHCFFEKNHKNDLTLLSSLSPYYWKTFSLPFYKLLCCTHLSYNKINFCVELATVEQSKHIFITTKQKLYSKDRAPKFYIYIYIYSFSSSNKGFDIKNKCHGLI